MTHQFCSESRAKMSILRGKNYTVGIFWIYKFSCYGSFNKSESPKVGLEIDRIVSSLNPWLVFIEQQSAQNKYLKDSREKLSAWKNSPIIGDRRTKMASAVNVCWNHFGQKRCIGAQRWHLLIKSIRATASISNVFMR